MKRTLKIIFSLAVFGLMAPEVRASLAVSGGAVTGSNVGGFGSAVIDTSNGFMVFGSSVPFFNGISSISFIATMEISPSFQLTGTDSYFGNMFNFSAAVFDPGTGFGYWASSGTPSSLQKIIQTNPSSFSSSESSTAFNFGQNSIVTAVIDTTNHFAYFGTHTSPSLVIQVELPNGVNVTSMTIISTITLPAGLDYLSASVIDTQNGFAYFGSSTTPGAVAKIKLSDFTRAGTLTFNSGEGGVVSAVIDVTRQFALFGTQDSPGKVVKVNLSDFSRESSLTLKSGEDNLTSAVLDAPRGRAYFGTNTSPGKVVQVTGSNLSENATLTLGSGQDFLRSGVIDTNSFAYFGTYTTPGQVIQVDLLAGPPTILKQPANGSVHTGETANFSVSAEGRGLTYQWQRGDVDIPGATSSAYSFTAATTDDGATFRCMVTSANGPTISNSAQLTIVPVIRAYPNPWRSDRHAGVNITFDGLLANSSVKIFNLAAHWVKTLPLASGSTTWDRTNDAGQTVASGYYVYLVTTGNDKQTVHGKLAIIK